MAKKKGASKSNRPKKQKKALFDSILKRKPVKRKSSAQETRKHDERERYRRALNSIYNKAAEQIIREDERELVSDLADEEGVPFWEMVVILVKEALAARGVIP